MGSRQRSWNIGNLLVLLLFLGLGLTFVLPHVAAARVARIEASAEEITAQLLAAATAQQPLALDDPAAAARLLAGMTNPTNAARLSAVPKPADAELDAGIYLAGKHHDYLVTLAPPPNPAAVEVYAWPNSTLAPTSTAFFFSQDGPAMYSHNLRARYAGLDHTPGRGVGRPRTPPDTAPNGTYTGVDYERWIRLPSRAAAPR